MLLQLRAFDWTAFSGAVAPPAIGARKMMYDCIATDELDEFTRYLDDAAFRKPGDFIESFLAPRFASEQWYRQLTGGECRAVDRWVHFMFTKCPEAREQLRVARINDDGVSFDVIRWLQKQLPPHAELQWVGMRPHNDPACVGPTDSPQVVKARLSRDDRGLYSIHSPDEVRTLCDEIRESRHAFAWPEPDLSDDPGGYQRTFGSLRSQFETDFAEALLACELRGDTGVYATWE